MDDARRIVIDLVAGEPVPAMPEGIPWAPSGIASAICVSSMAMHSSVSLRYSVITIFLFLQMSLRGVPWLVPPRLHSCDLGLADPPWTVGTACETLCRMSLRRWFACDDFRRGESSQPSEVPLTRAIASALSARSSGGRTVVCSHDADGKLLAAIVPDCG
jgi:hypothetical protein